MAELLAFAAAVLLGLVACCCFAVSDWHSSESDYWYAVDLEVRLHPERDDYYRPLLMWSRENRPNVWRRLRGWESPETRRTAWWARVSTPKPWWLP